MPSNTHKQILPLLISRTKVFETRSFLRVVNSMKGDKLAPVERIVLALQDKTCHLVDLAPEMWKVLFSEDNEISERPL